VAVNPTRVAVTGASGLVGSAVVKGLERDGHTVTRLVRSRDAARASDALYWNPDRGEIDSAGLAGHGVVVNLAGENIFGLWTAAKKGRIRRSRVDGTRLLASTLADLPASDRPELMVNASAFGIYGNCPPDRPVTEDHPPADTFLAGVVRDWEAATGPAAEAGVRVAMLRFGLVLAPDALLLQGTTLSTRLGLGATLGSGEQPFPWTTRAEIAGVVSFVVGEPALRGPINVAAPDAVTHREFADTVARVLNRPRFLRIPSPVIRLLGQLGDELLRGSRMVPARLGAAGYAWRDPELEPALRRMLRP
jgi:uncharacterized protein